jgi:sugar phosphate isomerase/epimerase
MCLAGLRDDPFTCHAADFERMVVASADAGFRGLSLWTLYVHQLAADGLDVKGIARMCEDNGLQIRVVEAVTAWPSGDRSAIDAEARPVFELAAELGAEQVLAVAYTDDPVDIDVAAKGFAYTCDLAARDGLGIALEFLPWTSVPDLKTAWALAERAGRDNGGLCIDSWHWQREPGGPDLATLRTIPANRIHLLQLNDAPLERDGDLMDETMHRRLLPGDGEVDLRSLFAALDEMGAEPIVAPEVFNDEIGALGPEEAARRIGDATRRVLAG